MKHLTYVKFVLIGFIIFYAGNLYALRLEKPQRITKFDDNALVVVNNALEQIWNLSNGRFNLDVKTSAPTWTGKEGDIVAYQSGATYRIYVYIGGAWRPFTSA